MIEGFVGTFKKDLRLFRQLQNQHACDECIETGTHHSLREARAGWKCRRMPVYAFGKLDAIGFGPFLRGIDRQRQPNPLAEAYDVLRQLSPAILAAQGLGKMSAFRLRVLEDGTVLDMPVTGGIGSYRFTVAFVDTQLSKSDQNTSAHSGLIIQTGAEDYLVAGQGMIVTFTPVGEGPLPASTAPGKEALM
jgi:hypothetical protein